MAGTIKVFFGSLESVRSPIFTAEESHPVLTAQRWHLSEGIQCIESEFLLFENLSMSDIVTYIYDRPLFKSSVSLNNGLFWHRLRPAPIIHWGSAHVHPGTPFHLYRFLFNKPASRYSVEADTVFLFKESLSSLRSRHVLPTYSHLDIYGYSPSSIHPALCGLPAVVCESERSAHARSAQQSLTIQNWAKIGMR